ncbi:nitric oxide reductase activation protein NorD [Desulfofundulus thermosubterraneus]|uniref:von Willebrand factor type A domain-containing protein n=1 Tax=Desulfofundulus thermosubterraneus DSM 16057 TaxID=1121432 RepID=A0A1M6HX79_9FIRM|nr:VWA domain-containing protein [Desulfofundulus thermosubterraneus]SHJ26783.1 von Willebrand factor type A domain-containing protein [Desulfofundulus thermosubterraneus DSM 16057]
MSEIKDRAKHVWAVDKSTLEGVLDGKMNPVLREAWQQAVAILETAGDEEFYQHWLAGTGELMAASWEVIWEWLHRSPGTLGIVTPVALVPWARCSALVARYAPAEAVGLIRSGRRILAQIPPDIQQSLLEDCAILARINWPAATVFYASLPMLAQWSDKGAVKRWVQAGLALAGQDVEMGRAYFAAHSLWQKASFSDLFVPWVTWGQELARITPVMAQAYFTSTPVLAGALGEQFSTSFLAEWADWARLLAEQDVETAIAFLNSSPGVLGSGTGVAFKEWAECGRELLTRDQKVARSFFEMTHRALQQATWPEVRAWVERAVRKCGENAEKLAEMMALATRESMALLAGLRQGITLAEEERSLVTYGAALFERPVVLKPSNILPVEITGGDRLFATTDGRRVYLPENVNVFPVREKNQALLRLMLVHEMAHLAEGTYRLTAAELAEAARRTGLPEAQRGEVSCLEEWLDLFPDYALMRTVFELVEDARVDHLTRVRYPGLVREYHEFGRLAPVSFPSGTREAGLASLARLSLGQPAPEDMAIEPGLLLQQKILANRSATVKESLEVAAAWYRFLADKPAAGGEARYPQALYRGRLRPDLVAVNAEVEAESSPVKSRQRAESCLRVRPGPPGTATAYRTGKFYGALKSLLQGFFQEEYTAYRNVYYYDEWDVTVTGYKPDWCRVGEVVLQPSTRRFVEQTLRDYYGLISTLKRYFAMLRPDRFRRYRRQEEGEQEDIDAIVEAWAERAVGAPATGFMIRRDKRLRDVTVAFLLDLSGSTNQVLDNGKTILDIEKEAVIIMAEALEVIGDRYALYGFNGEGRQKVNFYIVKEFNEPYGQQVQQKFGGMVSDGLTRLGAAIRHATNKLQSVEAAVKLLLILSDGRPYDVDYCAAKGNSDLRSWLSADYTLYAREDCRMALREARMKCITPFCITVDRKGKEYLEEIFGPGGYVVIDDVTMLPEKLPLIYKKLTV